jgi:hypothetical protein
MGLRPNCDKLKTKFDIYCLNHVVLRSKIKDGLAWNQDNESEQGDMSTREPLF